MPLIRVRDLDTFGIVRDTPSDQLPPLAFSEGSNIRFLDGVVQRSKGCIDTYGSIGVDPTYLLPWEVSGTPYWIYASPAKIRLTDGTTDSDVTRAVGGDYAAGALPLWNGGVLGAVPILNNGVDVPQSWDGATSKFVNLPNWPASTTAKVLRIFKQFIIALNITKSGTNYPTLVKWSQPAAPGTVPTSWDETDDTKDAGEYSLSETTGELIDCMPLGDINVVYKSDSIWMQRFQGGKFIFQSSKLFQRHGLLAQNCVQEFDKKHFFVSRGDLMIHNGTVPESVADGKIRRAFFAELDDTNYEQVITVANEQDNEIWVCIPMVSSAGLLVKAHIWNWKTGKWGEMELPNLSFLASGIIVDPSASTTFDSDSGTFDGGESGPFSGALVGNKTPSIMGGLAGASRQLYEMNQGHTFDGVSYESYIQRSNLAVIAQKHDGSFIVDPKRHKQCNEVWPLVDADPGVTLNIYAGSSDTITGDVDWDGPLSFDPSVDEKVDPLVSGRYLHFKFAVVGNGKCNFHGFDFNVEDLGMY